MDHLLIQSAAVYLAMEPVGGSVLVPLSLACLLTGLVLSLGAPWGLVRHYWVLITLLINVLATAVLLLYIQTLSHLAAIATRAAPNNADVGVLTEPSALVPCRRCVGAVARGRDARARAGKLTPPGAASCPAVAETTWVGDRGRGRLPSLIVWGSVGTQASRWLLVAAAVFGVLGMHSLVIDAHPTAMTVMTEGVGATPVGPVQDSHGSEPMSGHDSGSMNVLHLCLAILGAAVALLGLVLLATARPVATPARAWVLATQRRSSPRAPPTAPARLAELCVLRR